MLDKVETYFQFILAALDGAYGWISETISLLVLVIFFNFLAKWFLLRLHRSFERNQKYWQDSFVRALIKPLCYYVWFFAILHAVDLIAYRTFAKVPIANMHLVLNLGAIICFSWFCLRWKKNIVNELSLMSKNHRIAIEQSKIDVIDKLVTIIILFSTILLLMEAANRSINTLIAFGGVGGLAIAFASQEVIANFFGGIMVYATHPFAKGDWIQIPDRNIEGIVEEIGWYMTRIRSLDKRPIYVPNSIFSKVVVITPSRMTHRRIKETIGLRYCDNPVLKAVISDIRCMLQQHPDVDKNNSIIVNLDAFGVYSLDILIQAHLLILDSEGFAKVKGEILFKIADILKLHHAELATPSTTFYLNEKLISN
jgi:MscS family membrane protein